MRSLALWLMGTLLLVPAAQAATRHVTPGDLLYPTIQAGIDSATAGDTLLIAPGTWTENPLIVRKNLVLIGEPGPPVVIDAGPGSNRTNSGCALRTVSSRVELRNLTLRNSRPPVGAGIFMFGGTIDVRDCRFEDNLYGIHAVSGLLNIIAVEDCVLLRNDVGIQGSTATRVRRSRFDGGRLAFQPRGNFELQDVEVRNFGRPGDQQAGAVDLSGSQGTLERVLVEDNWSDGALGGIWMSGGTFQLTDVQVRRNRSINGPAGIGMDLVPSATLENCVVEGNVAAGAFEHGIGGLLVRRSNAIVRGSRFLNNHSEDPGGGISVQASANLRLEQSEVLANHSESRGGGLCVIDGAVTLLEVTVADNEAPLAGGIMVQSTAVLFADLVTVVANRAQLVGGIYHLGLPSEIRRSIIAWHPGLDGIRCDTDILLECVDLYGNGANAPCGRDAGNNVSVDPLFCSTSSGAALDLRLQSGSPVANTPACGRLGALPIGCTQTHVRQETWSTLRLLYR